VSDVRLEAPREESRLARIEKRPAYFEEERAYVDTPVYARSGLKSGASIHGPALIEEGESTCVIGPSGKLKVDRHGNLVMKISFSTRGSN
jgi:N-methylhydantoinase A